MKINHDYLKRLLEAFESSAEPITDIEYLATTGLKYEDRDFIFHMGILHDKGFVERDDGGLGFGMTRSASREAMWAVVPLRLTANGHEFTEALRNKEVWSVVKQEFKEASLDTLWRVSRDLLEGFAKKKVETLLGIGS